MVESELRQFGYPILIEHGALDRTAELVRKFAGAHRYAIISDTRVASIYGSRVLRGFRDGEAELLTVREGESEKTRESWASLTDELLQRGFGRDSTILALGGGVVGDLAGFVAGTYMRGVPLVHIPTTLLAMVDSSIGGKTGVDTAAGKNLVGVFHPPRGVVIDPQVIQTLDVRAMRTGFAEALKCGAAADSRYFETVTRGLPRLLDPGLAGSDAFRSVLVRGIEIKVEIVSSDERESGRRKVLNFGHTVGHAVETLSGYSLSHGEAIAIGMALESSIAERAGIAEEGTAARIRAALERAGLPVNRPHELAGDAIIAAMRSDKKARGGQIEYALPVRVGAMAGSDSGWAVTVADEIVREVLR